MTARSATAVPHSGIIGFLGRAQRNFADRSRHPSPSIATSGAAVGDAPCSTMRPLDSIDDVERSEDDFDPSRKVIDVFS